MTPQELLERLNAPHGNTEEAAEIAIMIYQAAKTRLEEIMAETGRTSIMTPAGKAEMTAGTLRITAAE